MTRFQTIYDRAAARKGGPDGLEALLSQWGPPADLSAQTDDRILSSICQHIMSAGFQWRVVKAKMPGHEEAFGGFEIPRVAYLSDSDIDALAQDTRVVRHRTKIASIRDNARMMLEVAEDHGSFVEFIAAWPSDDLVGLYAWLKKNGSRLGGMTGPRVLRSVGKDAFLLTDHVTQALIEAKVIDKAATSKKGQAAVQEAFNGWKAESGRTFTDLSRILAYTIP
jgi:3-methyladenine DNA glycosylase Tag